MLQVHQVSKSYGIQTILDNITFSINPEERVGLVGPNGSGKSTLLRILTGEETPDQGTVFLAPGSNLGYLPQGLEPGLEDTVGGYVRGGDSRVPGGAPAGGSAGQAHGKRSHAAGAGGIRGSAQPV